MQNMFSRGQFKLHLYFYMYTQKCAQQTSLQVIATRIRVVITGVALNLYNLVRVKFNKSFTGVRLVSLQTSK